MRMWGINPRHLCRQHLLGEHVEMHMLVGTINKGVSIGGYIRDGLVNVTLIRERHDALVTEMLRRKYNHNSPLPQFHVRKSNVGHPMRFGRINKAANYRELLRRCPECTARIPNHIRRKYEAVRDT